jgi:hypothetical protein
MHGWQLPLHITYILVHNPILVVTCKHIGESFDIQEKKNYNCLKTISCIMPFKNTPHGGGRGALIPPPPACAAPACAAPACAAPAALSACNA